VLVCVPIVHVHRVCTTHKCGTSNTQQKSGTSLTSGADSAFSCAASQSWKLWFWGLLETLTLEDAMPLLRPLGVPESESDVHVNEDDITEQKGMPWTSVSSKQWY
jgi:hypothetical protein